MRVVSGSARGRRISAPDGTATRPTSDRAREAIFNMVSSRVSLVDAVVLDLFAGSGAMGIEALSRGAAQAVFVESDGGALRVIRENLETLGMTSRAEVVGRDVETWLATTSTGFDVAIADPPYGFDRWADLARSVRAELLVVESDRTVHLGDGWEVLTERRYGGTVVALASPQRKVDP
ncbi:MAG: 16S rRNA (guanine(966)-N(2))-methyltransferase RsmD [Acidimicrobiales bacterium]